MGLEQLTAIEFPDVEHAYGPRDTILYALGIGFGIDPLDSDQLAFVYEPGLRAMPTMATVLAAPGFWYRDRAIDIRHEAVVHASERIELAAPLPAAGALVARTRVVSVIDKGAAKGVLIVTERKIRERATDRLLATVQQTAFCRADGGRGGTHATSPAPHIVPGRPPDAVCTLPTQPQGALIYRLSGDLNPLHADPRAARAAGFPRPILHGLATYGVIGHALVRSLCGYDPARLRAIDCRFTAPVFPGDAIRTEMWQDGSTISFRAYADDRMVADNGWATLFDDSIADCG
jgi:acyl dehydratase